MLWAPAAPPRWGSRAAVRERALGAAALVGAFVGAVTGALQVLLGNPAALEDPERLRHQLRHATDVALRPWR